MTIDCKRFLFNDMAETSNGCLATFQEIKEDKASWWIEKVVFDSSTFTTELPTGLPDVSYMNNLACMFETDLYGRHPYEGLCIERKLTSWFPMCLAPSNILVLLHSRECEQYFGIHRTILQPGDRPGGWMYLTYGRTVDTWDEYMFPTYVSDTFNGWKPIPGGKKYAPNYK